MVASIFEKLAAIWMFYDSVHSMLLLVVLWVLVFVAWLVPLNLILWAVGMVVILKKSPLKGWSIAVTLHWACCEVLELCLHVCARRHRPGV